MKNGSRYNDVSLFIVTCNDIIYVDDIDLKDKEALSDIQFIMLTNDNLNPDYGEDNTIFIHHPLHKQQIMRWQIDAKMIKGIPNLSINGNSGEKGILEYEMLNGYHNTRQIILESNEYLREYNHEYMSDISIGKYIPAVMAAYNTQVTYNGHNYHGFLPSLGQLYYIHKKRDVIYAILSAISDKDDIEDTIQRRMNDMMNFSISDCSVRDSFWSSTQCYREEAWTADLRYNDFQMGIIDKRRPVHTSFMYTVLPFFAIEH